MFPSPVSFDPHNLEEYGRVFRDTFANANTKDKEFHVINFYRSGFAPAEIRTCTGYALDFIYDVARRFAARCVIEFCRTHHQLIPHCACYEKTKKEK